MKQTAKIISTYAADVSGVCSALYELGGMTVMHDASGCNSTYNTHDEPRWYDMDSLVFISGLSEMEAVMGDDEKLVGDIVTAVNELCPKFIVIAGTPIPMLIGTDFQALAALCEERTGIPTFGFPTNGMHSYLSGASMAFDALAGRFVQDGIPKTDGLSANLLGVTPLDFSVNGSAASMEKLLRENGVELVSNWAMGSSLADLEKAGGASVNLVVSYAGLAAAKTLKTRFGTPYVVGTPMAGVFSEKLLAALRASSTDGTNRVLCTERKSAPDAEIAVIGESVFSGSLAAAIEAETGKSVCVVCPLETETALLAPCDVCATDEDELASLLKSAIKVIADPLYRPICPKYAHFFPLPHEAFSGRIYRADIPDLTLSLKNLLEVL